MINIPDLSLKHSKKKKNNDDDDNHANRLFPPTPRIQSKLFRGSILTESRESQNIKIRLSADQWG